MKLNYKSTRKAHHHSANGAVRTETHKTQLSFSNDAGSMSPFSTLLSLLAALLELLMTTLSG